jgi:CBS domain-containing protein
VPSPRDGGTPGPHGSPFPDSSSREADTVDQLMAEMTRRRFRHMPVVERDRLIGLVSIGDLVKIQISEIEMEAAATREYTA